MKLLNYVRNNPQKVHYEALDLTENYTSIRSLLDLNFYDSFLVICSLLNNEQVIFLSLSKECLEYSDQLNECYQLLARRAFALR